MVTPVQRGRLSVQVVCVAAGRGFVKSMLVPVGRSVGWCVRASGVRAMFPALADARVGVWGKMVAEDVAVAEGDRIEVYDKCDPAAVARARNLRKSVAPAAKPDNNESLTGSDA